MLRNEKGATAVEFALVFPLFIVLIFLIIEFSIVLYDKALVTHAAREAIRSCSVLDLDESGDPVTPTDQAITNAVYKYLGFNSETNGSILITLGGEGPVAPDINLGPIGGRGESISVTVSFPYTFLMIPNFIPGLPNPLTLSSTATMRRE